MGCPLHSVGTAVVGTIPGPPAGTLGEPSAIARQVGLVTAVSLRPAFHRVVGLSPQAYVPTV